MSVRHFYNGRKKSKKSEKNRGPRRNFYSLATVAAGEWRPGSGGEGEGGGDGGQIVAARGVAGV